MISVCIATYNGEKYIKEQIDSILKQLDENDEIIISDNYSTDNTLKILEQYNDKRIKIFQQKKSINYSRWSKFYSITKNFENAINKSSGDIILFSDQDDIWYDNKVEIIRRDLEIKSCVISNYNVINDINKIICNKKYIINPLKNILKVILFVPFLGCTMGIQRDLLLKYLPFPKNLLLHDIYIGLLSYISGNIIFENRELISYRYHGFNATTAGLGKSNNRLFFKIYWRIIFYIMIIFALLRYRYRIKNKLTGIK